MGTDLNSLTQTVKLYPSKATERTEQLTNSLTIKKMPQAKVYHRDKYPRTVVRNEKKKNAE